MTLANQECVPCRGGVAPMQRGEAEALRKEVPEWNLDPLALSISRTFRFRNFQGALDFVNKVGELAENNDHHPDITFGWGYCTVSFTTHRIKGLHHNDFVMAAKVDALAT